MKNACILILLLIAVQIVFAQVGIGVSDPYEVLEIGGSGRAFFGNGGGLNRKGLLIDGIQGTDAARIEAYNYDDSIGMHLVINTTGGGFVGIGTVTPLQKLHVAGNTIVTGNLGIGNNNPTGALHFANTTVNRKIVLWDVTGSDHRFYGFGINGGILRYQVPEITDNHVFYAGSFSSSNELMRIKGNGDVVVAGIIENEGWEEVDLEDGFEYVDGSYPHVQYYKDKEGRVHFRGLIFKLDGDEFFAFRLPIHYRPSDYELFLVWHFSNGNLSPAEVSIDQDGFVYVIGPVGSYSLSGISFRAVP